jgi:hypothetical protein
MIPIATKTDADLASADTARLVDLNDWAVNELRDMVHAGTISKNLGALVAGEVPRVNAARTCYDYLKCSRSGSFFRLNRKARRFIYIAVKTRQALGA